MPVLLLLPGFRCPCQYITSRSRSDWLHYVGHLFCHVFWPFKIGFMLASQTYRASVPAQGSLSRRFWRLVVPGGLRVGRLMSRFCRLGSVTAFQLFIISLAVLRAVGFVVSRMRNIHCLRSAVSRLLAGCPECSLFLMCSVSEDIFSWFSIFCALMAPSEPGNLLMACSYRSFALLISYCTSLLSARVIRLSAAVVQWSTQEHSLLLKGLVGKVASGRRKCIFIESVFVVKTPWYLQNPCVQGLHPAMHL